MSSSFSCPCGYRVEYTGIAINDVFAHESFQGNCCNCGGRKCMACCLRELHDCCVEDCPDCCVGPLPLQTSLQEELVATYQELMLQLEVLIPRDNFMDAYQGETQSEKIRARRTEKIRERIRELVQFREEEDEVRTVAE